MRQEKNAHQPYKTKEELEEINFELSDLVEKLIQQIKDLSIQNNPIAWHYITINNKKQLIRIPGFNPYLPLAKYNPLSLLICFDSRKTIYYEKLEEDYQIVAQNFINQTQNSCFGILWTGIYPNIERCKEYISTFSLPDHLIPLIFLSIANTDTREWRTTKKTYHTPHKKKKFIIF